MPVNGLVGRTLSLRSRRAEGGLNGAPDLVSGSDALNEEVPYDWRQMASPPLSRTTANIRQPTPSNTFSRPTRVQQISTGSYCLSSPNPPVSYGSLDGEMIGLALGSPHESPLPPLPLEDPLEKHMAGRKSPESSPTAQGGSYANYKEVNSEKPRLVKWRSFGGLFGRKHAVSPNAPFYQVQPSGEKAPEQFRSQPFTFGRVCSDEDQLTRAQRPVLPSQRRQALQMKSSASRVHDENPSAQGQRRVRSRRKDVKPAASPTRPKLPRSQTCPMAEQRARCPVPPPKDVEAKLGIATLQFNGGSLLQVEIPNVQLDRYSVMFENLLQAPPSSSLLARRHGHLEELGSTNQLEAQATGSLSAQLPSLSRAHSTMPARSPCFSLLPPTSISDSRPISSKERPAPSSLHRSLTSPNLTSSQRSDPLGPPQIPNPSETNHELLVIERLTDKLSTPRLQGAKADLDLLRHSHSSTEKSFHTAAESQSIESISNPPKSQQRLPKRSSSVRDGQPLRSSKSGILPTMYPAIATFAHNARGRILEIQDGKEGRGMSVAAGQAPATTPPTHLEDPSPEIKPAPPLRVLKNGYVSKPVPAMNVLASATDRPQQTEKGATLLQDGIEKSFGTTANISPLASHPTKPRIRATDAPSIPVSDLLISAPPLPPIESKTSMRPSQTIGPKSTVFISPPLPTSSTAPRPSTLPLLPSALETPEKPTSAAEISIARQISISRRQRELLGPLAPKFARQPMQPMLVDVRGGTSMARKSSHLIVEDA